MQRVVLLANFKRPCELNFGRKWPGRKDTQARGGWVGERANMVRTGKGFYNFKRLSIGF